MLVDADEGFVSQPQVRANATRIPAPDAPVSHVSLKLRKISAYPLLIILTFRRSTWKKVGMLRDYICREIKSGAPYEASPGGPELKITGAADSGEQLGRITLITGPGGEPLNNEEGER